MGLGETTIQAAALNAAERDRVQIPSLGGDHPEMKMDDAYAIQAERVTQAHGGR